MPASIGPRDGTHGLVARGSALVLALLTAAAFPLRAAQEEPAPAAPPAATPSAAAGETAAPARVVTGRIRGTVIDPSRRPIAGLMVQLRGRDQSGLLRVTGTDERGQYLFQNLPAGQYEVLVGADGYETERKDRIVVRPPFQNLVDFQLQATPPGGEHRAAAATGPEPQGASEGPSSAPVEVRGTFVDPEQRPVPEVSIVFVALPAGHLYQAFSDDRGRFSLPALPPGSYRVLVTSPGHVSLDLRSVEVAPRIGLDLSLSLVDHPLNYRGRGDESLPPESPLPLPAVPPTGAETPSPPIPAAQPAPSPAGAPTPAPRPSPAPSDR
jgi:Carboxypeptidase regulatory-like domain